MAKQTELNEASMLEALRNIKQFATADELRGQTKPTRLMVTDAGIAWVRQRYQEERWFRDAVRKHAARDPEYRRLCEGAGLILDPEPESDDGK